MPGVTGGKRLYHRGSPGGLTTARQCFAGTAWCPFTRIPPGGGFDCPPITSVGTVATTGGTQNGPFISPPRATSEDAGLLQAGPTGARASDEERNGGLRYRLGGSRTWTSVWWEALMCHLHSSSLTGCGAPPSSSSHAHL